MLTLANGSLSANSTANFSSAGPIILHGPHPSAQKSTSTGPLAFSTSSAKLWSLTGLVFSLIGLSSFVGLAWRWWRVASRSIRRARMADGRRPMRMERVVGQHGDPCGAGPDQRAAHGAIGEDAAQHRAIRRQLAQV